MQSIASEKAVKLNLHDIPNQDRTMMEAPLLRDESTKMMPHPHCAAFDQKDVSEMVDPNWIGGFLYATRPATLGDSYESATVKWNISPDDVTNGTLEVLSKDFKRLCILNWSGYQAGLHDGELLLNALVNTAVVNGVDVNGRTFKFVRNTLVEGCWPGFICTAKHC